MIFLYIYLQICIVHYVTGIVLNTRGYSIEQRHKFLPSWNLYSNTGKQRISQQLKIYQVVIGLQKKKDNRELGDE